MPPSHHPFLLQSRTSGVASRYTLLAVLPTRAHSMQARAQHAGPPLTRVARAVAAQVRHAQQQRPHCHDRADPPILAAGKSPHVLARPMAQPPPRRAHPCGARVHCVPVLAGRKRSGGSTCALPALCSGRSARACSALAHTSCDRHATCAHASRHRNAHTLPLLSPLCMQAFIPCVQAE